MTLETSLQTHDSLQTNNNMPTNVPAINHAIRLNDVSQDCRKQTISHVNPSDVSTLQVTEDELELWEQIKDLDFGLYQPLNGSLLDRLKQMKEELIQLQLADSEEFTKQQLADDNELQENGPSQIFQRPSSVGLYRKRGRPIVEYTIGDGNGDVQVEPVSGNAKETTEIRRVSFQDLTLPELDNSTGNEAKRSPSPRLDPVANYALLACRRSPPSNVSEGLRKYRRKSQFMVPSDIPTDVPLKWRHVENELRIKDTLEFIKRRLSVQTLHEEEIRPTPHLHGKVFSNLTFVHGEVDGTIVDSNMSSNFRNSSPIMVNKLDKENIAVISPTDSVSYMSSQDSEGMAISFDRPLNDEEINECLGNIPIGERHLGFLSLPKDRTGSQFLRSQSMPASSQQYEYEHHNEIYDETSSESLPKYVPLKKQRYKETEHRKDCLTPKKHYLDINTQKRYGSDSSIVSSASISSLVDFRLAANIRKDSIALFNTKLHDKRSRLRKISQASWAEFQQLKQKHSGFGT